MNTKIRIAQNLQLLKISGVFYYLCSVAVAVPLAYLMRMGGVVAIDHNRGLLTVGFVMFAAVGFAYCDLRTQSVTKRHLTHDLSMIAGSIVGGMMVAVIVMFGLLGLDGIPRSVPFLAVAIATVLAMLPRLFLAWFDVLGRIRKRAAQLSSTSDLQSKQLMRPSERHGAAEVVASATLPTDHKLLTDIVIVACLPAAILMAMLGPQGLTWFVIVVAFIMVMVLIAEKPSFEWAGLFRPIWSLLVAIALFVFWATGRSLVTASNWAVLPTLAVFNIALLSVIFAGLAAYRIAPSTKWYWSFFPVVQLFATGLLILAMTIASDGYAKLIPKGRFDYVYHYNRLALLVVLLYPLTLFAISQMRLAWHSFWPIHAAVGTAVIASIFLSDSESAKLALIVIVIVQFSSRLHFRLTIKIATAAAVALLLLAPLVMHGMYLLFLNGSLSSFKNGTFAVRTTIWEDVIQLVKLSPLLGYGVEIIRLEGVKDAVSQAARMHHHPHSFLLQTWVDLGLVGAILLSGCIVAVSRLIVAVGGAAGSMFLTIMAGILSIWAVSHGMWQAWYLGLSGIVVVFAILAYRRSLHV